MAAPTASRHPIMKNGLMARDGIARGIELPNNPKVETGSI